MRRVVLLLMLAVGLAAPSWAAAGKSGQVTVAQLSQFLAGAHGQSDGKVAKRLADMELTERVSSAQLARWEASFPGRRCREQLTLLADRSAFLQPPAADILADAPPDQQAQGAMLSSAINYVVNSLERLPDFYATRTTEHFEDNPAHTTMAPNALLGPLGMSLRGVAYVPLHETDQSSVHVRYQDGAEMRGKERMDRAELGRPSAGLTTAGEFGPILSIVLDDAMHGSITWGYWQRLGQARIAVFRYAVPPGQSNYVLSLKQGVADADKLFPAYHGEIPIDPSDGTIWRITVVADPDNSSKVKGSAIAVDYGKVQLGGKDYICPLKGVAILKMDIETGPGQSAIQTELNDVSFTGYHVARGDLTILPAQ